MGSLNLLDLSNDKYKRYTNIRLRLYLNQTVSTALHLVYRLFNLKESALHLEKNMKETMYKKEYLPSKLKHLEIIIMLVNSNDEEELEIKNKLNNEVRNEKRKTQSK